MQDVGPRRAAEADRPSAPSLSGGAARSGRRRDANLDLLRAAAISLVLVHHLAVWTPGFPRWVYGFTALGARGVDLFFVLSGWLIGGLYWRERARFGDVHLWRFWSRRWLRTLPPYFAALPIAFAGVALLRGDPFDWKYLVFAQNYERAMPFFTVSWSLCVEEHFYLLLPLSLWLVARLRVSVPVALGLVWVAGVVVRLLDPLAVPDGPFGYHLTATHLNLSGLTLGVLLAYLSVFQRELWARLQRGARIVALPLLAACLGLPFVERATAYDWADGLVALAFGAALASVAGARTLPLAATRGVAWLAACSYSVYLTHSMVLQAGVRLLDVRSATALWTTPILLVAIGIAGYAAFRLVERPAIVVRDRLAPRRSSRVTEPSGPAGREHPARTRAARREG